MSFVLEHTNEGTDLVLTGDWSNGAAECFLNGSADGLILNYARGYRERDLSFMRALPIRRLQLLARSVTELSPLYHISDTLEKLRIQTDPRAILNVGRMPRLRVLAANWGQICNSIHLATTLKQLSILGYTETDLTPLASLSGLENIQMKDYPRVRALDGIESMPWLGRLSIQLARALDDIDALRRLASPSLQVLELPACSRVSDISAVGACPALRAFDLSEGAALPTIQPLRHLSELTRLYLYGSTRVNDCDLTPILSLRKLKDFRMQPRRGYHPSVSDVQAEITKGFA